MENDWVQQTGGKTRKLDEVIFDRQSRTSKALRVGKNVEKAEGKPVPGGRLWMSESSGTVA